MNDVIQQFRIHLIPKLAITHDGSAFRSHSYLVSAGLRLEMRFSEKQGAHDRLRLEAVALAVPKDKVEPARQAEYPRGL